MIVNRERVLTALRAQLAHGRYPSSTIYGDGTAGPKIAECLAEVELTVEKRITY